MFNAELYFIPTQTTALFSKRLLELGPEKKMKDQSLKIIQACGSNPVDKHELVYDPHNPFDICAASYTPVYRLVPKEF